MKAFLFVVMLGAAVAATLLISRSVDLRPGTRAPAQQPADEVSSAIARVRTEIQNMTEQRDKLLALKQDLVKRLGLRVRETGSASVTSGSELQKKDPIAASYVRQIQQLEEKTEELSSKIIQTQTDLVTAETASALRKAGVEPSSDSPLQEASKEIGVSKARDVSAILNEASAATYHAPEPPPAPAQPNIAQQAANEAAEMKRRMAEVEDQAQAAIRRAEEAESRFRREQERASQERAVARNYSPPATEAPRPQPSVSRNRSSRTRFRLTEDEVYSLPGGVVLRLEDDCSKGGAEVQLGNGPKLLLMPNAAYVFEAGGRRVTVVLRIPDLPHESAEFETWAD